MMDRMDRDETIRPGLVREFGSRVIPITQTNITGTATGSAQTLLTVQENEVAEWLGFSVTNKTATAATMTLHAIPDGGSIGATNILLDAFSVPANTTLSPLALLGGAYPAGTVFQAFSGTSGSLNVRGAVRAYR